MGGKYSAEWWEKIASINGELSKPLDNPGAVEHFIARTASGRSPPATPETTPEADRSHDV
jgi:hypothetical protein